MLDALQGLRPESVWRYVELLSSMNRGSGEEDRAMQLVSTSANDLSLGFDSDPKKWILVRKPATQGMEAKPMLCLQSHLDMVCVPKGRNWNEGVVLVREGKFIRADGTSLGADNGIGVAIMLALMTDTDIPHGPLEFLFTCDEERGLKGAKAVPRGLLNSKILINLDSERINEICIGCAGGEYAHISMPLVSAKETVGDFTVEISGLLGGHSGIEIHLGHANALVIMNRLALELNTRRLACAVELNAGEAMNVIAQRNIYS